MKKNRFFLKSDDIEWEDEIAGFRDSTRKEHLNKKEKINITSGSSQSASLNSAPLIKGGPGSGSWNGPSDPRFTVELNDKDLNWKKSSTGDLVTSYSVKNSKRDYIIYGFVTKNAFGSNKYRARTQPQDATISKHQFYNTIPEAKNAVFEAINRFVKHYKNLEITKGGEGSGSWSGPNDPRFTWSPTVQGALSQMSEERKRSVLARLIAERTARGSGGSGGSTTPAPPLEKPEDALYKDSIDNMQKNLSEIATGKPNFIDVDGELNNKSVKAISKNAQQELGQYTKYLSTDSYRLARDYIDNTTDIMLDPSLKNISAKDMNALMVDSIQKIVNQEIESNRQQFTDHGIRHIVGNVNRMNDIMDAANDGNTSTTDKLMGQFIMINHDVGYTVPGVRKGGLEAVGESTKHKDYSEQILRSQKSMWNENKIFSGEQYDKILEIVKTHDSTTIDKNDILGTSVRLSDNLALFANDKLPSMFQYVDKGKDSLVKMGLAAKNKDNTKFEKYREELYNNIDKADMNSNLKRDLKASVKEISYVTPKFTLGVLAGDISNIKRSKEKIMVTIKYNSYDAFLQKYLDMGQKQTKKLLGDYGIKDFSQNEYDLGDFLTIRIDGLNKLEGKTIKGLRKFFT